MCYKIIPTRKFEDDVEYYVRKKKFLHIIDDIERITNELKNGNLLGAPIPNLNIDTKEHTYKVRSANTDTKVGKSNGYRLIYYVIKDDKEIFLITIYYKKEDSRIPENSEIEQWVIKYCL